MEGSEKWPHADHIAPFPGQCSTMCRGLPWACFLQWTKRTRRDNQQPWALGSHCGIAGLSVRINRRDSDCNGEGGASCYHQPVDLVRQSSDHQYPNSYPNQQVYSFAEPSQGYTLWLGNSVGCGSTWLRSSNEFFHPKSPVCSHPGKELSVSSQAAECLLTPSD